MTKLRTKQFHASLEKLGEKGLNWVIARVPFSVEDTWGTRGMLRVHVTVNGLPYRTSLFPTRSGRHFVLVNKKMQKEAGVGLGNIARFSVAPDVEPREAQLPAELELELKQDRTARKWYDRLSYSMRKWLCDLVGDAKSAATRKNRAQRVAEQIVETMEAERELPPMIRLAFQQNPGMDRAWYEMTEIQRRSCLLAIFYYRTPQSRMKRIEKVIQSALDPDKRQED